MGRDGRPDAQHEEYWENYFFEASEDAAYTVALWHPEQQLGRYSFVIGSEEIFGGDQECMVSMDALYVDGVKVARIYGEWYHLESLPDDAQMISVALYANNHRPLAVDGVEIADMVMIDDIMAAEPTIVDIAVADDRFETLVTALAAADLVDTLQGEGPFTVFAPTDEAFEALPEGTVDALLGDKAALTDVLLYHVAGGGHGGRRRYA